MFSTQRGRIPPEQVELVCFLQYQVQRKCICEGSILNIKATNLLFIVRELKFSQSKPFSGCLMDLTSVMKEDHVSKQISPSQEGPFKRILLFRRLSGISGQSVVLRILGPITQLLFLWASYGISRVPVSGGLLLLRAWCHSSLVVYSRISPTRLATNTGNL